MALLTKDQIIAVDDIPTEEVKVPEWGGSVLVRGLSGTERDRYEQSILHGGKKADLANATARLLSWTIVDENNSRLFITDGEVKELGKKSAQAIQRVFDVATRLSGLTPSDVEEMTESFD